MLYARAFLIKNLMKQLQKRLLIRLCVRGCFLLPKISIVPVEKRSLPWLLSEGAVYSASKIERPCAGLNEMWMKLSGKGKLSALLLSYHL